MKKKRENYTVSGIMSKQFSIKTKERLNSKDGENLNFGIVVTLKEINGVNRIDDFIHRCSTREWIVQRINVNELVQIYNIAEEEINFDG